MLMIYPPPLLFSSSMFISFVPLYWLTLSVLCPIMCSLSRSVRRSNVLFYSPLFIAFESINQTAFYLLCLYSSASLPLHHVKSCVCIWVDQKRNILFLTFWTHANHDYHWVLWVFITLINQFFTITHPFLHIYIY